MQFKIGLKKDMVIKKKLVVEGKIGTSKFREIFNVRKIENQVM